MDFEYIHVYRDDSIANLCPDALAAEIARIFTRCIVDVRESFFRHWNMTARDVARTLELARISDLKQPFEMQPTNREADNGALPLYDGFVLRRQLSCSLTDDESDTNHVHIVFTNLMTCTFDEDDWRYHGRAVICGTPAIISATGIVEAPAKPREFYQMAGLGLAELSTLRKQMAARFIDYGDERMAQAAVGYALQALFFFVADGEPFCGNRNCRLFNAHWQEDLIRTQIGKPALCSEHQDLANKFNRKKIRQPSF
ncbi:MAG: DUF6775 family putative metallopeptidase [Nitrososphaera sp.]